MLFLDKKRTKLLGFLMEYDSYTALGQLLSCQGCSLLIKVKFEFSKVRLRYGCQVRLNLLKPLVLLVKQVVERLPFNGFFLKIQQNMYDMFNLLLTSKEQSGISRNQAISPILTNSPNQAISPILANSPNQARKNARLGKKTYSFEDSRSWSNIHGFF